MITGSGTYGTGIGTVLGTFTGGVGVGVVSRFSHLLDFVLQGRTGQSGIDAPVFVQALVVGEAEFKTFVLDFAVVGVDL